MDHTEDRIAELADRLGDIDYSVELITVIFGFMDIEEEEKSHTKSIDNIFNKTKEETFLNLG